MDLYTPQLLAPGIYYDIFSAINWHNQRRYNNIKLDNKLVTHILDQSVNLSIFGVSVVETYNKATQYMAYEDTSNELFCALGE